MSALLRSFHSAGFFFVLFFCLNISAQTAGEDPQLASPTSPTSGVTTPGAMLKPSAVEATASPAPTQAAQPAGPSVPESSPPAETAAAAPTSVATPVATPAPPAAVTAAAKSATSPKETPTPPFAASDVESYSSHQDVHAVVKTSVGTFTIRLQPARAPKNVANFIALAKGTQSFVDVKTSKKAMRPFYNDLIFHRVIPGYLVQTGCPFGNGRGGPGYTVPDETSPLAKFNKPGIVAMAGGRRGLEVEKDTNGSQFFITVSAQPEWDGKYTVIGEVEKGMDVVERISKARTGPADKPIHRIVIRSIDIVRD